MTRAAELRRRSHKPRHLHPVTGSDGAVFGFQFGPLRVVRLAHIPGRGYWIAVQTEHDEYEVHASENGRVITFHRLPESVR